MLFFIAMALDWGKRKESELIDALLAGDESAFCWLVSKYGKSMKRVAKGFVREDSIAEEVVQETWMAAIKGLDKFRREASLKTWLFHILVNRARHTHRKESRTLSFTDISPADDADTGDMELVDRFRQDGHWAETVHNWRTLDPRDEAIQRQTLEWLKAEIENLPETQRIVVTMRDVEGLDSKEVCDALEISEANQRVLLHRGRTRLRQALEAREAANTGGE